jgi:tetratricopeptide (TPR) repeat protein
MLYIRIISFLIFLSIITVAIFIFRKLRLPARVRKADEHFSNGDYEKANEIINYVLEKKKDYVPARFIRAQIYIKQTQNILAITELNSILAIENFQKFVNELDIHYKLAELYNLTGQWQKEIEEYKIILNFNPEDLEANRRVGHAFFKQGRFRDANEYLIKAFTGQPIYTDCLLPIGVSCYQLAEYEQAEHYLLKSLEASPGQREAQFYLGMLYFSRNDNENALKMFENAKQDSRFFVKCVLKTGEIHVQSELYLKAIESLESGIGKIKGDDEESLEYRYLLAECYEKENKLNEALHHWEQISRINPNFRNTRQKIDDYEKLLNNETMKMIFGSTLDELQPVIVEIISGMDYNIVSRKSISPNDYEYKAFNVKRINEPPVLLLFHRSTKEVNEFDIIEFHKRMVVEKCKKGIYITTSSFGLKARTSATSRMIDLIDASFMNKVIDKVKIRKDSKKQTQ